MITYILKWFRRPKPEPRVIILLKCAGVELVQSFGHPANGDDGGQAA